MTDALTITDGLPLRTLAPGEQLLVEGDPPGPMYVLVDGTLEVQREGVTLTRVHRPGSWLGEMSMLLGAPLSATVRAVSVATVRRVDDPGALLHARPEIALDIARLLARRLHALNAYVVDLQVQFADSGDHLAMLDTVADAIMHAPAGAAEAGSERDPDPPY